MDSIDTQSPEYFDIVSAMWILSCNDQNPIMTNLGIAERLGLPKNLEVGAIVMSRRELFRPGLPVSRLEEWKARLRRGTGLPGWLQDITDPALREERINDISPKDVFRNQFRTGATADRCDITTMDWGLQHIERLRKAALEIRNEKRQRWSGLFIPAGSLVIAALSLIGSLYVQILITNAQIASKQYETTLKPKQDGYGRYMAALFSIYQHAVNKDGEAMYKSIMEMENTYFVLEPFLDEEARTALWNANQEYEKFCRDTLDKNILSADKAVAEESVIQFTDRRRRFQSLLFGSLFLRLQK